MERDSLLSQFAEVTDRPDYEIDVARAAMLLAVAEYPRLNVERELFAFQRLAGAISSKLLDDDDPLYCVNTLSEYLFDSMGFRGDWDNYYDPRNSYLNQVMERRHRHSNNPRGGLYGGGQASESATAGDRNARSLPGEAQGR